MNASDIPRKIIYPWASQAGGGYIHSVPDTGSTADVEASFQQGFPPATFTDPSAGGANVDGKDVNYILNILSAWARWSAAGGMAPFDATYASAIGGYPSGAIVQSTTPGLLWQSTADGNTTNPDSSSAANWLIATGSTGANSNGRWEKSAGGLIKQWGIVSGNLTEGTYSFNFPIQFLNSCENLMATAINVSGNNQRDIWAEAQSASKSGGQVFLNYVAAQGVAQCDGFFWQAVGT